MAINEWKPSLVLLAGMTAGIKTKVKLGDIVIPDRIIEYEAVKLHDDNIGFHGIIPPSSALHRRRIVQWPDLDQWLMKSGANLPDPSSDVRIHTEGMASGSKLVANNNFLDALGPLACNVCAIEMEAIGVAEACCALNPTPYVVMKGITDFADEHKCDNYQDVVCENIADLLASLVQDGVLWQA